MERAGALNSLGPPKKGCSCSLLLELEAGDRDGGTILGNHRHIVFNTCNQQRLGVFDAHRGVRIAECAGGLAFIGPAAIYLPLFGGY